MNKIQYEMFLDEASFHLWTVRPVNNRTYGNPDQRWFNNKKDAEQFLEQMNNE